MNNTKPTILQDLINLLSKSLRVAKMRFSSLKKEHAPEQNLEKVKNKREEILLLMSKEMEAIKDKMTAALAEQQEVYQETAEIEVTREQKKYENLLLQKQVEHEEYVKESEKTKKELGKVTSELKENNVVLDYSKKYLLTMNQNLAAMKKKKEELKNTLKQCEQLNEILLNEANHYKLQISWLLDKNKEQQCTLDRTNRNYFNFQTDFHSQKQLLRKTQLDLDQADEKLYQTKYQLNFANQKLKDILQMRSKEYFVQQKVTDAMKEENRRLQSIIEAANTEKKNLTEENLRLRNRCSDNDQNIQKIKEECKQITSHSTERVEELEKQIREQNEQIQSQNTQLDTQDIEQIICNIFLDIEELPNLSDEEKIQMSTHTADFINSTVQKAKDYFQNV